LRKRHTQASVPCLSAGRQESADHLLSTFSGAGTAATTHHRRTPESSSYNNNNNAGDYFTYICANQNNSQSPPPQITTTNDDLEEDQPNKIPEIRLAPPIQQEEQAYPITLAIIEDNVSLHVPSTTSLKHQQTSQQQDETLLLKESVSISIWLDDICCTLFPTLQDWNSKTSFAKLSALVAVPLVLIFTLTLPIAEGVDVKIDDIEVVNPVIIEESTSHTPQIVIGDQLLTPQQQQASANTKSYLTVPMSERSLSDMNLSTEEEEVMPLLLEDDEGQLGWCRWLVATQAICASTFVSSVMARKY
jgi:sodium/potassium/calcium exchanger 6